MPDVEARRIPVDRRGGTGGMLTPLELTGARSSRRGGRKAALRGRETGVSRRPEKYVRTATLDRAHDLGESRGTDTARVEHSRAQIARPGSGGARGTGGEVPDER